MSEKRMIITLEVGKKPMVITEDLWTNPELMALHKAIILANRTNKINLAKPKEA